MRQETGDFLMRHEIFFYGRPTKKILGKLDIILLNPTRKSRKTGDSPHEGFSQIHHCCYFMKEAELLRNPPPHQLRHVPGP